MIELPDPPDWLSEAARLEAEVTRLRAGIEKLRDEFVRRSDEPMVSLLMQDLARRLTGLLGDVRNEHGGEE